MRCALDHLGLNVTDEQKMLDFYSKVLQLKAERIEEYRTGRVPFPSVRLNEDTVIDLFPKNMRQNEAAVGTGWQQLNHFCLAMAKKDWDTLVERLSDNAVPITTGPVPRWGARGSGISIYFSDPEGNTIEARYYEKDARPDECLLGS